MRWHYRLRLPDGSDARRQLRCTAAAAAQRFPQAGWEIRTPHQCVAGARAQHRALHAVSDAGRPDRAPRRRRRRRQRGQSHLDRKRDVIATLKALGATGGARVRDLSHRRSLLLARSARPSGSRSARRCRSGIACGVRLRHPAADRARALSGRALAWRSLYGAAHGARLRALAARARARRVGLGAVPRRGGARAALAAPALCRRHGAGGRGAGGARRRALLRPAHRRDLRGRRGGVFVALRLVAALLMAARAPRCRGRARPRCGSPRQHPSAGRTHAERRALARPRPRAARHRDRDRRQSAPAVHGGAARARRRRSSSSTSSRPTPTASTPSSRAQAPQRHARARADAARPHHGGERHPRRRAQAAAERRLGAAERPRHHLRERRAGGLALVEGEWWNADYHGPPLVSFEQQDRRRPRPEARRPRHGQRARPQYHRAHRQLARSRLGEPRHQFRAGVLAQIPSAARRTPTSRRSPFRAAARPREEIAL